MDYCSLCLWRCLGGGGGMGGGIHSSSWDCLCFLLSSISWSFCWRYAVDILGKVGVYCDSLSLSSIGVLRFSLRLCSSELFSWRWSTISRYQASAVSESENLNSYYVLPLMNIITSLCVTIFKILLSIRSTSILE